jgi:hypothetical protein
MKMVGSHFEKTSGKHNLSCLVMESPGGKEEQEDKKKTHTHTHGNENWRQRLREQVCNERI